MKHQQHIGFWLAIVFVTFLLSPLIRSGPAMEEFVLREVDMTRSALGDTVTDKVIDFAAGLFEATPLGEMALISQRLQPNQKERDISGRVGGPMGRVMSNMLSSYLQGLALMTYVVAIRAALIGIWIALLLPFLIAAAHDGFMQRRIKFAEFGALRPATFTLAGFIVVPLFALPFVYLIIPYTLSPLLAPVWAFLIAIPLSIMISNMQPLFGR